MAIRLLPKLGVSAVHTQWLTHAGLTQTWLTDVTSSDYGVVPLDANLIGKLDDKEPHAAQKFLRIERDQRYRKSGVKLQKSCRHGSLRSGDPGKVSDEAKKETDIELGNATLPHSYEEIKSLLQIEQHPVYAKALEEWSWKASLCSRRVERKERELCNLKNEIYQLFAFYSLFQGVLLTAVLQNNLLLCNDCWVPISLSVGASIVTILGVILKLRLVAKSQKIIHSEERSLKEVKRRLNTLRNSGVKGFEFAQFEYIEDWVPKTLGLRIFSFILIGTQVLFAAVCSVSPWVIICRSGP